MTPKTTDHIQMLCDIGELNSLFAESISLESFLEKIVNMVSNHMHAEVCSIYLYDDEAKELSLKATKGLTLTDIQLKLGEGLVGQSLKELRPIWEAAASKNPHFKFIPGTSEEKYDAFIAAPILLGNARIGVLTIQRNAKHKFTEQDVLALKATTNQLANTIENARILMTYTKKSEVKPDEEVIKNLNFIRGKSAAKGLAFSQIAIFSQETSAAFFNQRNFEKKYSLEEFEHAIKETEKQLEELQKRIEEKLSDVASLIFSVHLLMLKDSMFIGEIEKLIEEGENPPIAALRTGKKFRDIFAASPNLLIQEKVQDLEDLLRRLLNNLLDKQYKKEWYENHIVIANELLPSDILKLSSQNVSGIILVKGGITSHVSILARSLQVPLVIANIPELLFVPEKTMAIVDGESGNIYINPSDEVVTEYKKNLKAKESLKKQSKLLKQPTQTKDGTKINLFSNINLLSDLELAKDAYAEGIGLYRTEFPFIIRTDFPSEEEQFVIYEKLVKLMPEKPITFRTLDIGGDKVLTYYFDTHEKNPSMGLRSIRFSLKHQDVFVEQLRAILRAGRGADLRIMFPMISSFDELLEAKKILEECKKSLAERGEKFHENPKIGIMIEIPSILDLLEEIANHVDFFSIGTNDLLQFLLAVDRTNEKLADFYDPYHPAMTRALKKIIDVAQKTGKEVSICGDISHDETYLPFLLGIGFRDLSLDANYIPKIKQAIRNVDLKEAEAFSQKILSCTKLSDIKQYLSSDGSFSPEG